jgi:hypothetical protein
VGTTRLVQRGLAGEKSLNQVELHVSAREFRQWPQRLCEHNCAHIMHDAHHLCASCSSLYLLFLITVILQN